MTIHQDKIDLAITRKYGSTEEPNYAFVMDALRGEEHIAFIFKLSQLGYKVTDDTDPNTDVSRLLVLSGEAVVLTVRLSFVGRFAAVSVDPASKHIEAQQAVENVTTCLKHEEFEVFNDSDLGMEIAFRDEFESMTKDLYYVLFSADRE